MSDETDDSGLVICGGKPEGAEARDSLEGLERCPKCGEETTFGFGLAFGGYGPYVMCMEEDCDWAAKQYLSEDAE